MVHPQRGSQDLTRHAFLSYSCAVFDEEAKGCTGDLVEDRPVAPPRTNFTVLSEERTIPPDDLERGQLEKLHLIAKRARITPGTKVLEIGSVPTSPSFNFRR